MSAASTGVFLTSVKIRLETLKALRGRGQTLIPCACAPPPPPSHPGREAVRLLSHLRPLSRPATQEMTSPTPAPLPSPSPAQALPSCCFCNDPNPLKEEAPVGSLLPAAHPSHEMIDAVRLPSPLPSPSLSLLPVPAQTLQSCCHSDLNLCKEVDPMGSLLPAHPSHVMDAVRALRSGHVIAVPTDTLYGLAADACLAESVNKIYEMKGRNMTSPLAVCVADVGDLEKYSMYSYLPEGLVQKLLPGPVTLVLQRGDHSLLDKSLNPGLPSIGIRIPNSGFIQQVAEAFGGALALTSANISGQPSPISTEDFKELWEKCAYVFDAGQLPVGRAGSTIVDLTVPHVFKIIRQGSAYDETTAVLKSFGLRESV